MKSTKLRLKEEKKVKLRRSLSFREVNVKTVQATANL